MFYRELNSFLQKRTKVNKIYQKRVITRGKNNKKPACGGVWLCGEQNLIYIIQWVYYIQAMKVVSLAFILIEITLLINGKHLNFFNFHIRFFLFYSLSWTKIKTPLSTAFFLFISFIKFFWNYLKIFWINIYSLLKCSSL